MLELVSTFVNRKIEKDLECNYVDISSIVSVMTTTAYERFLAAFRALIDSSGHGIQADLARALGKTPRHINDIYKGRANASLDLQERIANFFQLSYEEMLSRGRAILERGEVERGTLLPEELVRLLDELPEASSARANVIYDYAAREVGIAVLLNYWNEALGRYPPGVGAYLNGEMGDEALYDEARKFAMGLRKYFKKQK